MYQFIEHFKLRWKEGYGNRGEKEKVQHTSYTTIVTSIPFLYLWSWQRYMFAAPIVSSINPIRRAILPIARSFKFDFIPQDKITRVA